MPVTRESTELFKGASSERLIALAEVARPHGIRGEVRLKLYNHDSDLLLHAPEVILERAPGEHQWATIVSARGAHEALLITLEGYHDRTQAEGLRGTRLLLPRSAFPPPEEGEFYICDIVNAKVQSETEELGRVEEVLPYPTCDVLVVRNQAGATLEIPLVDMFIDRVDVPAGVIYVHSQAVLGVL